MSVLINVVLPVFLVAGVAALAQRWLNLEARTLSRAVFYIFGPALVFDSLVTTAVGDGDIGRIGLTVLAATGLLWLVGLTAGWLLRLERPTQAAFLTAILLANTGNYGLSVNLFAFGDQGLAWAAVYFTVGTVVTSGLGVYLSAAGRAPASLALRRVVTVPMLYAALLGLAFNLAGWQFPEPVSKAMHLLGQASVPVMLAVLGLNLVATFRGESNGVHWRALAALTLLRLALAPLLTWAITGVVGLEGLARDVTVVESAMPTAVMTTILATEFESDAPFASLAVLVTTLASLVTVTTLLNILT
ncbi:MAG: AEC family transporter [Anaerolineae bacterium]|nr:AEC family transporter [Anaerolineae bacterium]